MVEHIVAVPCGLRRWDRFCLASCAVCCASFCGASYALRCAASCTVCCAASYTVCCAAYCVASSAATGRSHFVGFRGQDVS